MKVAQARGTSSGGRLVARWTSLGRGWWGCGGLLESPGPTVDETMPKYEPDKNRCEAMTVDGTRCTFGNAELAVDGRKLCHAHHPDKQCQIDLRFQKKPKSWFGKQLELPLELK